MAMGGWHGRRAGGSEEGAWELVYLVWCELVKKYQS